MIKIMNQYLFFYGWESSCGGKYSTSAIIEMGAFTGHESVMANLDRLAERASEIELQKVSPKQIIVTGVTKIETPQGE